MWHKAFAIAIALLLPAFPSPQRRGRSAQPINPSGAVKDVEGSLHGKLKLINGKEVVFENDDGQTVSVRRTRKTKFVKDGKPIKPDVIAQDTAVIIDVMQDIDLKPLAVTVTVEPPPKTQ